ncbi:MAG: hypothetical protein O3C13_05665 [Bacteroidetes bacterium]|jgi:hypothetical protein|nr:hypothetical protein [Bacteroidota bacterium]MDA0984273.1 hypothetical protein [Bacteroidota bacterium]
MDKNSLSAQELLHHIEQKIQSGNYNDSVHKIKLLTAKEVIEKILLTEF